jgi:hypothetical protein
MMSKRCLWMLLLAISIGHNGVYAAKCSIKTKKMSADDATRKNGKKSVAQSSISAQECALRQALDKLWTDHVVWTRQVIVSSVAGLADADAATKRLMKNQEDLGNAIVPYYGAEAGAGLTKLLKEHIMFASDMVKAGIAGNKAALKVADKNARQNATDLAVFLNKANPASWPKHDLEMMFNEHLDLLVNELNFRLEEQWQNDVTNYDKVVAQALDMAKSLSDGIVKQFPSKF